MKINYIRLRPDRLNWPLASCFVGKLSSAVFLIGGDIPDDIENIEIQIGRTPDPDTGDARDNFTVAATEITDSASALAPREFRCYIAPLFFPDASTALKYHVIGTDSQSMPRWLGTGDLVVLDNPANGSADTPEIIPADTYIRNPATGLYHLLTAELNEDGELTISLDPEGIER